MIQRVKTSFAFCWLALATAIVVFAVLLQLIKLCLPHINSFNSHFADYAGRQLNAQVTIGEISARWPGLRPEISLSKLSLVSHDGVDLFSLDQARMQLDVLGSLFHWTPVWHSVEADGGKLHIEQDSSGAWTIGGIKPATSERGWRYRSPSALFLMAGDVKLSSSNLLFTFHNQNQIETNIPLITIQNNGHFHRLNARADLGEDTGFDFILEGVGDPAIADQFFAEAYLKLNRFPVERLAQLFSEVAIGEFQDKGQSTESEVNLSLWLDFASPSRFLVNGTAELVNNQASSFAKRYYLDIPLTANMVGDFSIANGLSLGLRDVHVDNTLHIEQAHVGLHEKKLTAAVDHLNVRDWVRWANQRLVRVDKINQALEALAPQGQASNLYASVDLQKPENSFLEAKVNDIHTRYWKGVPEMAGVSGYVVSRYKQGQVFLDTDNFVFHAEDIYDQAISAHKAKGLVGWTLDWSSKRATINGHDLAASGDYGELNGYFSLDVGWQSLKEPKYLQLQLGLQNADALDHQQLVPDILPESILQWMSTSIKAGKVDEAGLLYRGGLGQKDERSVQFYADIDQGELDFRADWPALKNLNGRLFVDNRQVFGELEQASIYENDQFKGRFNWNENKAKVLRVKASGRSSANSGLRFLQDSPLQQWSPDLLKQIKARGLIDIDVDLAIPLDDSKAVAKQNVGIHFNQNRLSLGELSLALDDISGKLYYDSEKSFFANRLTATLLGQEVAADIGLDPEIDNTLLLSGRGKADIRALQAWLQQPTLDYMAGNIDYQFSTRLPVAALGQSQKESTQVDKVPSLVELAIESNLIGLSANLPPPFSKQPEQALPIKLFMPLEDNKLEFTVELGSYLSAHFFQQQGQTFRASVAVGDEQFPELNELPEAGLNLLADFNYLEVDQWLSLLKGVQGKNSQRQLIQNMNASLAIDQLAFNNRHIHNLQISSQRENSGWSMVLDSDDVLGAVYIDDSPSQPVIVDLDYLHWKSVDQKDEEDEKAIVHSESQSKNIENVLANFDPRTLPTTNISIETLFYNDKPLGRWSMQLMPDTEGVKVQQLYASLSGFTLAGKTDNQGASLQWQAATDDTPESTRFDGQISGGNPQFLFEQWGLPFGLESKETRLQASLFWPGSPASFQLSTLGGTVTSYHRSGAFTQDKTNNATGFLRLVGLFNFDSWARRVRLDFSDIYKKGIAFDKVNGELRFREGIIELASPLTLVGPSSKMSLSGSIDSITETVDANLVATIPIGGNLTVVAALAGGLPAAAGVYLVSKLFEKQVEQVSSINYRINGSWSDPVVKVERLGDDSVEQQFAEEG